MIRIRGWVPLLLYCLVKCPEAYQWSRHREDPDERARRGGQNRTSESSHKPEKAHPHPKKHHSKSKSLASLADGMAVGTLNSLNALNSRMSRIVDEKITPAMTKLTQKMASAAEKGIMRRGSPPMSKTKTKGGRVVTKMVGDPDRGLQMEAFVRSRGYPIERHNVTTPDGYSLGMFRIPYGVKPRTGGGGRPAVLLQHGIMDSSIAFVQNYPHNSLGYVLADEGYDVWFGNNRGNVYSRAHRNLSSTSRGFWNFTWDQFAALDLPTEIEHVLRSTGAKRLAFVGHSEGSCQAFAAFSSDQVLASKVSVFVALAPTVYVKHARSPLLKTAGHLGVDKLIHTVGDGMLELASSLFKAFGPSVCKGMARGCESLMDFVVGRSEHINASRIHIYNLHYPSGTSTKNIVHWGYGTRIEAFSWFDYESAAGNMVHYGTWQPPSYRLQDFRVPTAFFTGSNDLLADPEDVERLKRELRPGVVFHHEEIPTYAHLDFTLAQDAGELLYPQVLQSIASHLP